MGISMKLNKHLASFSNKDAIIRAIRFCLRDQDTLAGLPFRDMLVGSDGVYFELIVPEGTGREICEQAIREAYASRDVVRHGVIVCPSNWFALARESQ